MKKLLVTITTLMLFLIVVRQFVQTRYCPSSSMEPTLQVEDRFLTHRWGLDANRLKRGDIVLFYPPKEEVPNIDDVSALSVLGDLTGLPIFPNRVVFIKRIIGLPGDTIEVKADDGVYVNRAKLHEPYCTEPASYSLLTMGDIGGKVATGKTFVPYPKSTAPIVVPKDTLLLLGDNRNNSQDSHVHGFVNCNRLVSKAWMKFSANGLEPIN